MRDRTLKYALAAPAVILLAAITLFPVVYLAAMAFSDVTLVNFDKPWQFIGLQNFREILFNRPIVRGDFVRTVEYLVVGVSVEFALGTALALLFNRTFKGKNLLSTLLLIPIMLTPVVMGMMWKALLNQNHGLVNEALAALSLPTPAWLSPEGFVFLKGLPGGEWLTQNLNLNWVFGSVILIDIWQWTPFVFLLMSAGLASLPHEPYEAALVDGASPWQTFRHVTLPLLRPVIGVTLLIRSIDALKAYDTIWAIFGDSRITRTLNIEIYNLSIQQSRIGLGAALSVLMLALITIACSGFAARMFKGQEAES